MAWRPKGCGSGQLRPYPSADLGYIRPCGGPDDATIGTSMRDLLVTGAASCCTDPAAPNNTCNCCCWWQPVTFATPNTRCWVSRYVNSRVEQTPPPALSASRWGPTSSPGLLWSTALQCLQQPCPAPPSALPASPCVPCIQQQYDAGGCKGSVLYVGCKLT